MEKPHSQSHSHSAKEKIHQFFENPSNGWAYLTQAVIFLLIIASVATVVLEFWYESVYQQYTNIFEPLEYAIVGIFTVEYLLRITTAPKKFTWALKPFSIIDFVSIAPFYLSLILPFFLNTNALRVLRLLRFARVLRVLRLFRYGLFLKKVFRYKKTILESITPILAILIALKGIIWVLEYFGFWIQDPSLGELFAIIGFALGIILSQKIGSAYDKFNQVEETSVRLYGTLRSIQFILNKKEAGLGTKTVHEWVKVFLELLEDPKADNNGINQVNGEMYKVLSELEDTPAEMATLHGDICRDSAFCLSKKVRLTPKAYDTLLHQSTILYLGLIAVFIPAETGMISIVVATYILYGMYNLTEDFDSIVGGNFDLINIDISELKQLQKETGQNS